MEAGPCILYIVYRIVYKNWLAVDKINSSRLHNVIAGLHLLLLALQLKGSNWDQAKDRHAKEVSKSQYLCWPKSNKQVCALGGEEDVAPLTKLYKNFIRYPLHMNS
jgi:hypothetical protein